MKRVVPAHKVMKNKANKSAEQFDLFASVQNENPTVGFTKWADDKSTEPVVILDSITDDGVDHKAKVIKLAKVAAKARGDLASAIIAAQEAGYSDSEIKLWMLEAGWAPQSIANELSSIRIKKGNRQRGTGGGRKVKNEGLVNRFTDVMALMLGEGEYDAKAISAAALAAARLVKEGKVEAKKAE